MCIRDSSFPHPDAEIMPILTGHKFHIGPLPQIGMTFQHRAQFFQPDPLWVWAENDGVRVPHSNLVDRVLLPHRLQLHLWIRCV